HTISDRDWSSDVCSSDLLAATNRPDILDPALLRPGRFDRQIVVDMPDVKGREQILRVHTRKIPLGTGVNLERIAKGTPGLSGAEIGRASCRVSDGHVVLP